MGKGRGMGVGRGQWVAALAFVVALLVAVPGHAAETIERFHADVLVQPDGSLEVTETIAVRAEGSEIRRGIVREFPTRYRDRFGNRVVVDFEMIGVERNGRPEPFWTELVANGVEVFLGDDSFLEVPQTHTYTLRYHTSRQLGFFETNDELYWNVTGTGWIFPIEAASARVRLPEAVAPEQMHVEAYTGVQDATGGDYRAEVTAPGEAVFEATRPLGAGEGLTIALAFPKGVVAAPSEVQKARWLLADNAGVLVALVGLLMLLAWYLWQWHRKGRDPAPGVVFPRYDPPEGHTPGGIRYLRKMGWDNRCFTADLVDAGVHGVLTIHRDQPTRELLLAQLPEHLQAKIDSSSIARYMLDAAMKAQKETWRLERNAGANAALLPPGQKVLVEKLFGKSPMLTLSNRVPETVAAMQGARSAHKSALSKQYTPSYFNTNLGVVVIGFFWTALFTLVAFSASRGNGGPLIALMVALALVLDVVFLYLMKQPTPEGRRLLDEVEGLRMYLGVAEKDELARVAGPGAEPVLDAARYEALLPYALALEVEEAWTAHFTAAATAAGVGASADTSRWYRGNLAQVGNLGDMSKSLGTALSSQIASSSSPPGSRSGSGGGGSSGGGGGGGGGRGR